MRGRTFGERCVLEHYNGMAKRPGSGIDAQALHAATPGFTAVSSCWLGRSGNVPQRALKGKRFF